MAQSSGHAVLANALAHTAVVRLSRCTAVASDYRCRPLLAAVSHFTFTSEPNTVHGHFGFPPYEKGRKPCKPASCRAAADWSYHLVGVSIVSEWGLMVGACRPRVCTSCAGSRLADATLPGSPCRQPAVQQCSPTCRSAPTRSGPLPVRRCASRLLRWSRPTWCSTRGCGAPATPLG